MDSAYNSQWLFPIETLSNTPSTCRLERELYDRARGIEFLYRVGMQLNLPTSAIFTAATWFHRFYMRFSMEDFHRQDVAASCIFLATKTEECGRKLRDVAKVYQAKTGSDPADNKEVDHCQATILMTEEVLLEALCFDFVVESPHANLIDLFNSLDASKDLQEHSWSLAHDSYRTPLCLLFPPKIIAIACYVLAQRVLDGPNSPSLDARISATSPSYSLPTPPSHQPPSPDASRAAVDHYNLSSAEVSHVADAMAILLEFYSSQDHRSASYLSAISSVQPPQHNVRPRLYLSLEELERESAQVPASQSQSQSQEGLGRTPVSSHGGFSPLIQSEEISKPPLSQPEEDV
ncbi:hypothetical protein D9619_005559 [Psilocybe cf. subviscida]|uniref:Cyclin-like domain-containing protein n=1 Tax=Psilocybe cf. subviscida TaxID=2480587 RepID=A0A8H5BWM1_9AGAR|nr:hypothetical protein D9619_005559 [Psilocybe cf. subviscida]